MALVGWGSGQAVVGGTFVFTLSEVGLLVCVGEREPSRESEALGIAGLKKRVAELVNLLIGARTGIDNGTAGGLGE